MLIRTLLTCLALLMLTLPSQRATADIPPPPDTSAPEKDSGGSPPTSNDDGGCVVGAHGGDAAGGLALVALGFALTLRRRGDRGRRDRERD